MLVPAFLSILLIVALLCLLNQLPLELTTLVAAVLLIITGCISEAEAFAVFGQNSFILLASLSVIATGLSRSGAIDRLFSLISFQTSQRAGLKFLGSIFGCAIISIFLSNLSTMSLVLPRLCAEFKGRRLRIILLPAALVTIVAGSVSLLGSSNNIFASALSSILGTNELRLFSLAPIALPLSAISLFSAIALAFAFLGSRTGDPSSPVEKFELRAFTTEVEIHAQSSLAGLTLGSSPLFREVDVTVLGVVRGKSAPVVPQSNFLLQAGDRLIVEGNLNRLNEISSKYSLIRLEQIPAATDDSTKKGKELKLEFHELVVSARSMLCRRTPGELYLRPRYRISLLAINREGTTIRQELSRVRIASGDVLLVQFLGHLDPEILEFLGLVPLETLSHDRNRHYGAILPALIYLSLVALSALGLISLVVAMLLGAIIFLLLRVVKPTELIEIVDWRSLIIFGGFLMLGRACVTSSANQYLASLVLPLFQNCSQTYFVSAFVIIAIALAEILPSALVLAILIPLLAALTPQLGFNITSALIPTIIASSLVFLTRKEEVLQMVLGVSGYTRGEFYRVGALMTLVLGTATVVLSVYFL